MAFTRFQLTLTIVVGICVTFLASTIKSSYQIYFIPLTEHLSVSQGELSVSGALFGLSVGVMSPLVGWICDRYGALPTIFSGAVVTVVVFLLLTFTDSYLLFLPFYGVLAAYALTAMTYVPLGMFIDQVFHQRQKGMAFAAISNGTAIGFILLSPILVWLSGFISWSTICLIIGLIFLVGVVPMILLLNRKLPKPSVNAGQSRNQVTLRQVMNQMKTPVFICLAISFAGCGASMGFIDVHLVPLIQQQFTSITAYQEVAASTLSLLGIAELCGAVIIGWLLRNVSPTTLLTILYLIRGSSLLLIYDTHSSIAYLSFAVLFGLTYMGTVIITSLMCLNCFGKQMKGRLFGFLFTAHQLSVFLTVSAGGILYDVFAHYHYVVLLLVLFCGLSAFAAGLLSRTASPTARIGEEWEEA
ncbi:MFS transporter [Vibrio mangrovi]|uniref:MFS transporter n=1 Tax=Vibrio mangrovi TaxID=474394 RepID=A0A1Y6ISM7_9VIBR|nr:MFS transporter [Vibrio mangrovi]MDW6001312.1 MFS transporter [Vibrio mangrovi]SMS00667.1 Major Facilitator Superfamily protein [Vibrio mangrovi]